MHYFISGIYKPAAPCLTAAVPEVPEFGFSDYEDSDVEELGTVNIKKIEEPLHFQEVGEPVWLEEKLGSNRAPRPLGMIFIKEGEQEVLGTNCIY